MQAQNQAVPRILGVLGGMSWASTKLYYQLLNTGVARRRGKQHSAELIIASVDFQTVIDGQVANDWERLGSILAQKAQALEAAGAGAFLIASNTMHRVVDAVKTAVAIPCLDIFDATAAALKKCGHARAGLLGTKYTMADPFFVERFRQRGIEIITPAREDARRVNEIIFRELIHDRIATESVKELAQIAARLAARDCGTIILGCTELVMGFPELKGPVPLYDTTEIHAETGVNWLVSSR